MKEENVPLDCPASLLAIRLAIPPTYPVIPIRSKKWMPSRRNRWMLCPRNRWMTCVGMGGWLRSESVDDLPRNTQLWKLEEILSSKTN